MCDKIDRIDLIRPQPGDVIAAYINREAIDFNEAVDILKRIKPAFPNNQVVMMPDEIDLICYSKEKFIAEIDKIKDIVLSE